MSEGIMTAMYASPSRSKMSRDPDGVELNGSDDFGAGLSSFAYLKNFNVDMLKIDGSFIVDIAENRISESMVAAITQVAKVMNLQTVAEFVQNEETRDLLAEMGVDFAQGHLFGKPKTFEEVVEESRDATPDGCGNSSPS